MAELGQQREVIVRVGQRVQSVDANLGKSHGRANFQALVCPLNFTLKITMLILLLPRHSYLNGSKNNIEQDYPILYHYPAHWHSGHCTLFKDQKVKRQEDS